MKFVIALCILLACGVTILAQATRPTTVPSSDRDTLKSLPADQVMDQLLRPTTNPTRPLGPLSDKPVQDKSSGSGAVKPDAPSVNLLREGTYIFDRAGRLSHNQQGQAEITFDSDGKALHDPPLIILPNQTLMRMEDAVTGTSRDLRFRVTGMITEYRGRNYILLDKVHVIEDTVQQF